MDQDQPIQMQMQGNDGFSQEIHDGKWGITEASLKTSFMDLWPMQSHRVTLAEGPCTWFYALLSPSYEIPHNFFFELMFWK